MDGHYVLVVGCNDNEVIIHDPLWPTGTRGMFRHISNAEWVAASQKTAIVITGTTPAAFDHPLSQGEPDPTLTKTTTVTVTGPTEADVDVVIEAVDTIVEAAVTIANNESTITVE